MCLEDVYVDLEYLSHRFPTNKLKSLSRVSAVFYRSKFGLFKAADLDNGGCHKSIAKPKEKPQDAPPQCFRERSQLHLGLSMWMSSRGLDGEVPNVPTINQEVQNLPGLVCQVYQSLLVWLH